MHQDDLKENDKFILFCKIALGKTQARHSFPQTEATTFAFSSVFIFFLCLHLRDLCLYPSSMRESNAEKKTNRVVCTECVTQFIMSHAYVHSLAPGVWIRIDFSADSAVFLNADPAADLGPALQKCCDQLKKNNFILSFCCKLLSF